MKLRSTFVLFALAVIAPASATSAETNEAVVMLAPFVVEGSYSDVRFSARFRYHIPGKALKALILKKVPQTWTEKGMNAGDWVVSIDGIPVDGKSIPAMGRLIEQKTDTPMKLEIRPNGRKETKIVEVLFKKDSGDLTIQYP